MLGGASRPARRDPRRIAGGECNLTEMRHAVPQGRSGWNGSTHPSFSEGPDAERRADDRPDMTSQKGQDERSEDPPDIAAARLALAMLEAAREEGDPTMIACAELLAYAAARALAAHLDEPSET